MLGKRITEVRKKRKLSQAALGQLIDTSGDMVGRYEREVITPSIDVVIKIAEALEISLDYLVGKTSMKLDNVMLHRLEKVEEMPEEERNVIYRVLDALIREYNTRKSYE